MRREEVLKMSLSTGSYKEFSDNIIGITRKELSAYICVANVHMLIESHTNNIFSEVLQGAEIITPDGKPLVWALRLLYGIKQDRVAGMDLLPDLLHQATYENIPVFFYGGSQSLLNMTKEYLNNRFPGIKIAGLYSPPFRELTHKEDSDVIDMINNSGAKLVFVVLGCPKQEKWMAKMKGSVNAVMVGVGGALPVMVGLQKRAPKWIQKWGLEWFYRLYQEPIRLFKRYAITNTLFIYLFLKELIKIRLFRIKSIN